MQKPLILPNLQVGVQGGFSPETILMVSKLNREPMALSCVWSGARRETIKMVTVSFVPLNPNLKVGENERSSFYTVSVAGGSDSDHVSKVLASAGKPPVAEDEACQDVTCRSQSFPLKLFF